MSKISNLFKKYLATCVMSAVMFCLPICLTGCNSNPSNPSNNGSTLETGVGDNGSSGSTNNAGNTSGLGNTSNTGTSEGSDDNTVYPETLNELLSRSLYAGNDDKVIHPGYTDVVENTFTEFSIDRVIDNSYFERLNSVIQPYINLTATTDTTSTYVYVNYHQASAIYDLISTESSYAFDVYKYNETDRNSYQIVKDGDDTFLIIITKKTGEKLYNGFYHGTAYTDGVECFSAFNFPVLTTEYLELLNQSEASNKALLWCQNVLSFCLGGSFLNKFFEADVFYALKYQGYYPNNNSTGFNFEIANLGGVVTSNIYISEKKYNGQCYSPIQTRIHYGLTAESLATEQGVAGADVLGASSIKYTRTIAKIEVALYYGNYTIYKQPDTEEGAEGQTSNSSGSLGESASQSGSSLDGNSTTEPITIDEELYPEITLLGLIPTTINSLTLPQ